MEKRIWQLQKQKAYERLKDPFQDSPQVKRGPLTPIKKNAMTLEPEH